MAVTAMVKVVALPASLLLSVTVTETVVVAAAPAAVPVIRRVLAL